jgi:hypothetical protein
MDSVLLHNKTQNNQMIVTVSDHEISLKVLI